ncbi:MFS transporter [Leucobacter japonicus]|uniref:MFS transporter n=1 Tax=Leucobacter japonicus TaxID=1461259 RepID=UPI000A6A6133|nr:MFS transporter [Leucobacter japonicus]
MHASSVNGPGRIGAAVMIAALVCGGFGIGVSEFIVMGLLPRIAGDLLPETFAAHPDAALAATGGLASAYALGVVIGMLVTPLLIRRLSERGALLACAGSMLLWTVLTALAPSLGIALVLRFLAALTHASFIGVGAMATAHLLGSQKYGRGAAIVHGGLAVANLLGVPVLTAFGEFASWRLVIGACAVLFAVPVIALLIVPLAPTPLAAGGSGASVGGRRFGGRRLWLTATAAVLVASGGFAVVTYIAPVVAEVQGDRVILTPALAMLAFGVGMNLGNFGAGWVADRAAAPTFLAVALIGVAGGALLLVPGIGAFGAAAGVLLIGVLLGGGSPAAQVLFLEELRRFPRLASSMPSGTANLGSFIGSLAGAGLLAGFGAAWLPVGTLVLAGLGLLVFALRGRRIGRAPH